MALDEGTLRSLTGGRELKPRVQHPKIQECKDRAAPYWFFRYRHDEARPGGSVKTTRKRHICGPSKGSKAITRKQAEIIRDDFLHDLCVFRSKWATDSGE